MKLIFAAMIVSALSGQAQPGSQRQAGDQLKNDLFTIYQRSHTAKLNRTKAGYDAVYSRAQMRQFQRLAQEMHLSTFEEYMFRIAELEKRLPERLALIPQTAESSGNKAVLKMLLPRLAEETWLACKTASSG